VVESRNAEAQGEIAVRWLVFGTAITALALPLAPVSGLAAPSGDLIANVGFEQPIVPNAQFQIFAAGQSFSGWKVVGAAGNVAIVSGGYQQNGFAFPASSGQQWLDLTGSSNTATGVEQSIPTTPGTEYHLSFSVGNVYDPAGVFGTTSTVTVIVAGRPILSATNSAGRGVKSLVWQRFNTTLRAISAATTVEFINGDPPSDTSNGLDDVSLVAATGPSSIATSLPTPAQAFSNPVVVAVSVAVATGGALFITFPAQLFNLTFEENYPAIAAWVERRRRRFGRILRGAGQVPPPQAPPVPDATAAAEPRGRGSSLAAFVIVLALGSLLGSLLDPKFGANLPTVETYIGVVLAVLTSIAVKGTVAGLYHRRRHRQVAAQLHALPLGLAVAIVCVVVSRLTDFQPGYLYGVICGVTFAVQLNIKQAGHLTELTTLAVIALSVIAWLLWVPVNRGAIQPGAFSGLIVLDDFLAALFVGGLVGTAVGLLPLRFLPGHELKRWSTFAWASTFAVAVFGVIDIIVLSSTSSGGKPAPLLTTIILFVLFGGATLLLREVFIRRSGAAHGVSVVGFRAHVAALFSARPAANLPTKAPAALAHPQSGADAAAAPPGV
jgi:hypothetical protein